MGGGITQGRRRSSSDARVGYRIPDLSYCGRRTMPAVKRLTHVPPAVVPPPPMREAQVRGNELDSDRCASRATAHNAGDLVGERNRDKLEGFFDSKPRAQFAKSVSLPPLHPQRPREPRGTSRRSVGSLFFLMCGRMLKPQVFACCWERAACVCQRRHSPIDAAPFIGSDY